MHFHKWVAVERIGDIVTYRCARCGRTRTRVNGRKERAMGLFRSTKVPNTISDKKWGQIQRGANRTEAREGGMFSSKAVKRRKTCSGQLKKSWWS